MSSNIQVSTSSLGKALAATQLASVTPVAVYTVPAATSTLIKQGLLANISGQVITLSAALSTGGPITALPINPLPLGLISGSTVTTVFGSNSQTWTLTADAPAGATSLAVASQTPNFAYPVGIGQTFIMSTLAQTATVVIHHIPASGGALNGARVILQVPVLPGDSVPLTTYLANMQLGPGDALYIGASIANIINVSLTGVEST